MGLTSLHLSSNGQSPGLEGLTLTWQTWRKGGYDKYEDETLLQEEEEHVYSVMGSCKPSIGIISTVAKCGR